MKKKTQTKDAIEEVANHTYPSVILGLDISTSCIGASIIEDDGINEPKIRKITHVVPKISPKINGIEALILKKEVFEREFLTKIKEEGITECVIEAPLTFALGNSNPTTVSQLLKFNALLSEAIYYELGIIPYYISSLNARIYSFPQVLGIRKFNRDGKIYPLQHCLSSIKDNHVTAFAEFPFDCDKKVIMMNYVCEKYPYINWAYNSKGDFKKENYDACDSLVCSLAYSNIKRYGKLEPKVLDYEVISPKSHEEPTIVRYKIEYFDKTTIKELSIPTI